MDQNQDNNHHPYAYTIENFNPSKLDAGLILNHCSDQYLTHKIDHLDIQPEKLAINTASFTLPDVTPVEVTMEDNRLTLFCFCTTHKKRLCPHQAGVLFAILHRPEIRIFFDRNKRQERLREEAVRYGFGHEANLNDYFKLEYTNRSVVVSPKLRELFPVHQLTSPELENQMVSFNATHSAKAEPTPDILVFGQHKYYKNFTVELFEAQRTQKGKIKNPLKPVNPLDLIWKSEQPDVLKFLTAISGIKNNYRTAPSAQDIEALKALVRNPLGLSVFYHNTEASENVTAASIVAVQLAALPIDLRLSVSVKDNFYEVTGFLMIDGKPHPLESIMLKYNYFLFIENALHLIENYQFLRVMEFFKQYSNKLLIHQSKFEEFRKNFLSMLEHKIHISYTYLKPATKKQLQETSLEHKLEKLLYLSDTNNYILITPVMKYGPLEVPVRSKKQLYLLDLKGEPFTIPRNEEAELQFITTLLRQSPDLEETNGDHYYLHKSQFLDKDWFLETFEAWQQQDITVLGFAEINKNKYNPNKAKISVQVNSGIDWFDTSIDIRFGNQKVALKHLHKAVKNKSRFIPLDDGTSGILPAQWIEKFAKYFHAGEIQNEKLRTPKINFSTLAEMYDEEMLTQSVKAELALYRSKIAYFETIEEVTVPADLNATLRDYQKQGLNWLNFLDEYNFGGCLADDMGLGKTIQAIAFILSQRNKKHSNTNLVVAPTSLIFNWQAEVAQYAPSLKLMTLHGADRITDTQGFDKFEIILTTYGTLLSDIRFLKNYTFNYIVLDESQAIKNPESQRYKAARLLQSRNKIVLTGTPVENNTFDLYGQLSFACPGLLGSKQYFKQHFSAPIDQFSNRKRALELQQKINPFILRRTKQQVARELPEKTEMVVYCEMGAAQRKVYDAYARRFRDFLQRKKDDEMEKYRMHVLQGFTKLRQICNAPVLLADEEFYGETSAKIDVLMDQIESKSSHHKILIFSQFVSMLDLIRKNLNKKNISHQYLTGQTKDRAGEVAGFQNDPAVRVFLISLKAGGTGLNLTEADYIYLVDPWWNPAVENQAIDRAHRIGQDKKVVAVRLICPDTIEEKMMKLQESKKALAGELVRTDDALLKSFSKKELLELFR